jgi:hypothetical protein
VGLIGDTDFTVLVSMSSDRNREQFYVLPSRVVREEIAHKRDGTARKDTGHWRLKLAKRKDGRADAGYT